MSDSLLTRCPHCQSIFQLTAADLEPAYGAVRCGECMKIFNALNHQVSPDTLDQLINEQQATLSENALGTAIPAPGQADPAHNNGAASSRSVSPSPTSHSLDPSHPFDATSLVSCPAANETFPPGADPLLPAHDDELQGMFDELEPADAERAGTEQAEAPDTTAVHIPQEASEPLVAETYDVSDVMLESPSPETTDTAQEATSDPTDETTAALDDALARLDSLDTSWSETENADDEATVDTSEPAADQPEISFEETDWESVLGPLDPIADDLPDSPDSESTTAPPSEPVETPLSEQKQEEQEADTELLLDLYDVERPDSAPDADELPGLVAARDEPAAPLTSLDLELEADDVDEHHAHYAASESADSAPSLRRPLLLWGMAAVLLLGGTTLAYGWLKMDTLARSPALRPLYAALCIPLGCELPALMDLSAIRSSNVVLRPHPRRRNLLAVEMLITNQADFPQPYPQVDVALYNLNHKQSAQTRFRPDQYLLDRRSEQELMQPGQPVRLTLLMNKPDTLISGHEVTFHPSQ